MSITAAQSVGIDRISCYTPGFYLDLKTLANLYEKDPAGYYDVLGQEQMSIVPPDEDSVTLGCNAANQILKNRDNSKIKTLYFATESGIDQSKSAGLYVFDLLKLPADCRVIELKQACYSGTFALRSACERIMLNPEEEALIICSDIARYGLGSPGEPTQGAGAVAMLVKANPAIAEVDAVSGVYSQEAMDFWRPNYRTEAFVDGQYSVRLYIKSLLEAWQNYNSKQSLSLSEIARFCFHLPFSTIAERAYSKLCRKHDYAVTDQDMSRKIEQALCYNRLSGNCYTASLYQSLASLLDNDSENLERQKIALFSYGSGSVSELLTVCLQDGYQESLSTEFHQFVYNNRKELSYEQYKEFYTFQLPTDGQDFQCPRVSKGAYRLAGIKKHKRIYERNKNE